MSHSKDGVKIKAEKKSFPVYTQTLKLFLFLFFKKCSGFSLFVWEKSFALMSVNTLLIESGPVKCEVKVMRCGHGVLLLPT